METTAQQSVRPSFAQLEAALAKARAANNQAAVDKISSMLREPLSQARVKALEAGNEVALSKIIDKMQSLGFDPTTAAAIPVAPPGPIETQAPQLDSGAVPMGTPTQQPDFDPSQRDMGGPQVSTAPMAPPVAPSAPPAPTGLSTSDIIAGREVPVALPTTVVTATDPRSNLTDKGFESDPTWIGNAKRIYQETEGKPFEGADADAAKWLKNYVAQTKWNMAGAGTTIYDALNKLSPDGKAALLQSIDEYGKAPTSLESVGRGLKGVATDPTTYATAGLGNIITKTIGKKGAEAALRQVLQEGIKKQAVSRATQQAATAGAGYGAASNLLEQGVQVSADGQESIDPTQVATAATGGAVVGAGANKIIDRLTGRSAIRNFARGTGSEEGARVKAEIAKDFQEVAQNPNLMTTNDAGEAVVATALRNQKASRYVSDVQNALKRTDPELLKQYDVQNILTGKRVASEAEINLLKETPGGKPLGLALEKYQKAMAITAPTPASGAFTAKAARGVIENAPRVAFGAAGAAEYGLPGLVVGALMGRNTNLSGLAQRLTGKSSVPEVISQLSSGKNVKAADKILETLGPSQAKTFADDVAQRARQVESTRIQEAAQRAARAEAAKKAKVAQAAQSKVDRDSILEATGMPLGGSFQELLQGGRSGLNLTSDAAIDALRIVAQKNKGNPLGTAANQIRRSSPEGVTDPNAFYGIQNEIRKLQERGVLGNQPGALSEVTQGSGIRNPISYAANVRNAESALKLAQDSAPSNALAQFASVVARTKTPEAKAALVQQRLLRTTDPVEAKYLTDFIEPLTRFGAKSK
jgi:hypothetical protein